MSCEVDSVWGVEFECIGYIVTNGDCTDNALAAESCDMIQIQIQDDKYELGFNIFCSDAHHLKQWCEENGYEYTEVKVDFTVKGGKLTSITPVDVMPCPLCHGTGQS